MKENGVYNIVFSSSATVYGDPKYLPLDEKHPVGGCTNPYGKTKYFIEEIMSVMSKALKVLCLSKVAIRLHGLRGYKASWFKQGGYKAPWFKFTFFMK